MGKLYDDEWLPFPPVGSKIRQDGGKGNPNTWAHWGTVEAIVNDDVMIVLRCAPVDRKFYEMIDRIKWDVFQRRNGPPIYKVKQ